MSIATRRPSGKPSWPILLLAGREGAGKSWAAASASASELVGRTLWIGIGEDDPDEYGAIPGADFEIVEHDGTYPGIIAAVRAAVAEPQGDLPTLIVVDSMTRLWNLIGDNMQAIANQRAKGKRNAGTGDYAISMDLWNTAASQWTDVMDALRIHQGPVLLTARLDEVVVMDDGKPSSERSWKVQGHKSLPFDAAAVIQLRERGQFLLTKVKSARHQLEGPSNMPGFTVDSFWRTLGLGDTETGERAHATVHSDAAPPQQQPAPAPAPAPPAIDTAAWSGKIRQCMEAESKDVGVGMLRTLHTEAKNRGLLQAPAAGGMTLDQVLRQAKAELEASK